MRMTAANILKTVFGVAALLAALAIAVMGRGASAADGVQYLLGPGDQLRIIVFGEEDLSGEFVVDGSGVVSLPLIGGIRAAGRSAPELISAIEQELSPDYLVNPRVSIEVLNYRPFYIFGEVQKPGSYPYVEGMTVVKAVVMAGGYTYRARQNHTLLRRADTPEGSGTVADHDTPILPGDVIEVPERFF